MNNERLFKILRAPHVSEKSSAAIDKTNTIVLKVLRDANKKEIKAAIEKLFEVKVHVTNTLIVKNKSTRSKQYKNHAFSWKKAYVTLKKGYNLNIIGGAK